MLTAEVPPQGGVTVVVAATAARNKKQEIIEAIETIVPSVRSSCVHADKPGSHMGASVPDGTEKLQQRDAILGHVVCGSHFISRHPSSSVLVPAHPCMWSSGRSHMGRGGIRSPSTSGRRIHVADCLHKAIGDSCLTLADGQKFGSFLAVPLTLDFGPADFAADVIFYRQLHGVHTCCLVDRECCR